MAALELYREVALFAAADFQHMHAEETLNNATLWARCSDEELKAVHGAIVASVRPDLMQEYLSWMLPALSPAERAGFVSQMRAGAPAPVFEGILALARAVLDKPGWMKLCSALEPAPVNS